LTQGAADIRTHCFHTIVMHSAAQILRGARDLICAGRTAEP
jgi:hypothetical protein